MYLTIRISTICRLDKCSYGSNSVMNIKGKNAQKVKVERYAAQCKSRICHVAIVWIAGLYD